MSCLTDRHVPETDTINKWPVLLLFSIMKETKGNK